MKRFLKLTVLVLALLSISTVAKAGGMGPPPPGGGMGPKAGCWPPGNPKCVPIDGGVALLIAAGLAYGGRKTMQLRKK